MKYRGIIHFHSNHSYDSFVTPEQILATAKKNAFNFLILTDHDTIDGSVKLRNLAKKLKHDIEIPIAAEYKLDCGDVIAAFIATEVKSRRLVDFEKEVRSQGGMILFPHPFHHHTSIEQIATVSDIIEVFNSRQSDEQDVLALELAAKKKKAVYYSSDAHLTKNLTDVVVEFAKNGSLKESLLTCQLLAVSKKKSSLLDMRISQTIKDYKKQKWLRLVLAPLFLVRDILKSATRNR